MDAARLPAHLMALRHEQDPWATHLLVVECDGPEGPAVPPDLGAYPGVTVGLTSRATPDPLDRALDVLLTTSPAAVAGAVTVPDLQAAIERIHQAVAANPIAARVLAQVLRHGDDRSIEAGLVAESTAYSTLLAGAEFGSWLAARGPMRHRPVRTPLRVTDGPTGLHITLDRPAVRNAVDAATREALIDVLAAAALAGGDAPIVLDGAGGDFCAGGDLSEFGTASDPAAAHLVRTARSPARWLTAVADRVGVRVHGACVGAGLELAAFAGLVQATPDAWFALPEVAMGLIPGAGGTVSLPRRIGRQRTAWLAITGHRLDQSTALRWGLVDQVAPT